MRLLTKSLGFWARKVLHIVLNGVIAIAVLFVPSLAIIPLTVIGFILILIFESLRLKTRAKAFVNETMGPLFKAEEALEYSGLFWAAIGALVVAQFAEAPAYSFAFAVLATGDAGAAITGKLFGKKPFYMKKSYPGSIACFVLTALVAMIYATVFQLTVPFFAFVFLTAALITLLEVFSYPFDDNFMILVMASYVFHLALNWV